MTTPLNKQHPYPIKHPLQKLGRWGLMAALPALFSFQAATAQDRPITLDEAIKLGLQNSKTLRLSQSRIDQAVNQYNQAKDLVLPTGSASFAYSRAQIPANKLTVGEQSLALPKSANANLGTVSAEEVIYGGGRYRYAKESTDLLVQVARLDADRDKDQIAIDIVNEYYNLYKVLQNKKVVQANLNAVDQQIHQAQRLFDQGLVTKNDVLRFQLQRSNIELNGIDLENNRKIINFNLDVLLGLPESTQLNITQVVDTERPISPLSSYLDTALATRQELTSLDLRGRAADINIKNVRANQLPTLAATAAAYYLDISANPFPTKGNFVTPITAGLALSWNFGSLWNNKNKVAQARIERDQISINRDVTLDNIKNEVNRSYQNYVAAVDRVHLLQASIAQANENNRITASRYANSTASATDRADAETLVYQAQTNLELAKADVGMAYYNLLKSTGKLNKQ
ncbi:TolC family protein [Mucilaginibacter koreensis]